MRLPSRTGVNAEQGLTVLALRGVDPNALKALKSWCEDCLGAAVRPGRTDPGRGRQEWIAPLPQGLRTPYSVAPLLGGSLIVGVAHVEDPEGRSAELLEGLEALLRSARQAEAARRRRGQVAPAPATSEDPTEALSLEEFQRRRLLRCLEQNEWNLARVARVLGVSRQTVYARLKRHGLPRRRPRRDRNTPTPSSPMLRRA